MPKDLARQLLAEANDRRRKALPWPLFDRGEAAEKNEEIWRARLAERGALKARAREADDPAEEAELLRQAEQISKAIREDDYADRRAQEEWMAQGRPPPPGADTDTGGKDG